MGASNSKTNNNNKKTSNKKCNINSKNNRNCDTFIHEGYLYVLSRSGNNYVTKYKNGTNNGGIRVGKNNIPDNARLMNSSGKAGNVTMGQRRNMEKEQKHS